MNIFSDNYLYKIRLIGYTVETNINNTALTNVYFKSHNKTYKVEFNQNLKTLQIIKDPDITKINNCNIVGLSKQEIVEIKNTSGSKLNEYHYDNLVSSVCKQMFAKSKNLIASKAFVFDFINNKLLVNPKEFTFVNVENLIERLK